MRRFLFYFSFPPLFLALYLFISGFAFGNKSDSLHYELKNASDTIRVNILLELAELNMFTQPDSTIYFGETALRESENLDFALGQARSFMRIADGHYFKNEFSSSIEYLSKASVLFKESNDSSNYAECLNRIGVNYNRLGDYGQAKIYSTRALQIYKLNENYRGQWKCVSNLGIIAKELGDLNNSLEYHFESLKIAEKLADPGIKKRILTNIGNTYNALDEIDESLQYYYMVLKLSDSLGNKKSIAMLKNNIATSYAEKEEYEKAEAYYLESLAIKKELGDFLGTAISLNNLGFNYIDRGRYNKALQSFQEALKQPDITDISKSNSYIGLTQIALKDHDPDKAEKYALISQQLMSNIDNMPQKKDIAETLYEVYESKGDYKKALEYLQLFQSYEDSLFNKEKLRDIGRLEARHEFDIKEQRILAEQLQQDLINEKELSEQKLIAHLAIALFLIMLITSFFVYRSHQQKHKSNKILHGKNIEILHQKEKIEKQANKLSELNALKDRVFSIVSHDLRNPILSIKSLLDMAVNNSFGEEEFKKFLPIASKDVNYTLGMLNNLLLWSNSQMNGENINPESFSLQEIIIDCITLHQRQATEKNIFIFNKSEMTHSVYADKNMIKLIFRNLLSNAIKFCEENDEILISTTERGEMVEISIEDTGVGIPPKYLNKLFQNNNFTTRGTKNEKGTGIGLMLCKEFVEKNGGNIWVESSFGKGTKFYFTLPLAVEVSS